MKKFMAFAAALFCATPAFADDNTAFVEFQVL